MNIKKLIFMSMFIVCSAANARLRFEAMFPLSMGMALSPYSFIDKQSTSVIFGNDGTHYWPLGYGLSVGNPGNADLGHLTNQASGVRFREYALEKWYDGYYIGSDPVYVTRAGFGQWPSHQGWWVSPDKTLYFPISMADLLRAARSCDGYNSPANPKKEYSVNLDASVGNNVFPPDYSTNQNYYNDQRKLFRNKYYGLAFPPTMPGSKNVPYFTSQASGSDGHTIDYYLAILFQYNDWKNIVVSLASIMDRPFYGTAPKKIADNSVQEPNNFQAEFSVMGSKGVDQIVPSDYFMGMAEDGDIVLLIHAQDPDRGYSLTYDQTNKDPYHQLWTDKPGVLFHDKKDLSDRGYWPVDYSQITPL